MIQLPRRSVTRFFIPLIDVLTLLFCIFLLMPLVKKADGEAPEEGKATTAPPGSTEPDKPADAVRLERERQELERIRKERIETLQHRLAVHVLEIDGATGKLFEMGPERVEIARQADALA